jgi:hypothetical protein
MEDKLTIINLESGAKLSGSIYEERVKSIIVYFKDETTIYALPFSKKTGKRFGKWNKKYSQYRLEVA